MRRALIIVREVSLTLAALGGVACVVLVVLAFTGGYSLIMFKTGSMHPTIPAGSVALVQEIPAAQVHVGDIITVDRAEALPVTHRVTSVAAGPSPGERTLTMRGDANQVDDPFPYVVDTVRVTKGSVPELANVLVWFGSPWVMGAITLATAALVTWAFWPRDQQRHPRVGRYAAGAGTAVAIMASALAFPVAPAQATEAGVVTLRSSLHSETRYQLHPTDPLLWDLTATANDTHGTGDLSLALSAHGDEAAGVRAAVHLCTVEWSGTGCQGTETVAQELHTVPVDGAWRSFVDTTVPGAVFARVQLTAAPAAGTPNASVSVTVRATAQGSTAEAQLHGEPHLAATGSTSRAWLLAAPVALALGLGIVQFRRITQREGN